VAHVEVQHLYRVFVQTTDVTLRRPSFFTEGVLARVEGDEDFYSFSRRGLGSHRLPFVNRAGVFSGQARVTGAVYHRPTSRAGMGGQLCFLNTAPPRKRTNQGQCGIGIIVADTWNPGQAPPFSMYCSKAVRCAALCGKSLTRGRSGMTGVFQAS